MADLFARVDLDGHERTIVALRSLDVEIPRDLAVVDLRAHQVRTLLQGRPFPSVADLQRRWGWTRIRVRHLVGSGWSDPFHAEAWARFRAGDQPSSSHSVATEEPLRSQFAPVPTPDIGQSQPASSHSVATEEPLSSHTLSENVAPASLSTSLTETETVTTTTPDCMSVRATPSTGSLELVEAVATATALQQADHPERGTRLDLADRRRVEEAVRNGATPDDLARVWAWVHLSGDSEASFLRGRGLERWRSILNDNAGNRLAASRRWEDRGRIDVVEPGQPQRRQRRSEFEMLAAVDQMFRIQEGNHGE